MLNETSFRELSHRMNIAGIYDGISVHLIVITCTEDANSATSSLFIGITFNHYSRVLSKHTKTGGF
jgi:hypothetical protein